MGWYCHPDTLSIASASLQAEKEVGNRDSLEYKKAYRRIYYEKHRDDGFAGFDEYIKSLDSEIEAEERKLRSTT